MEAANSINELTGQDSVAAKIEFMQQLFSRCKSDDELRFLVRSFADTGLRIGLSTKSVEKCVK